jgi:hypothetical protein
MLATRSRALALLVSAVVVLSALAVPAGAAAVTTSLVIFSAPSGPVVANTPQRFAANMTPDTAGATVRWYVSGGLVATTITNPNGVVATDLVLGPGGYEVQAVLEGTDDYDWAWSQLVPLTVTADPEREPDGFAVAVDNAPTVEAAGDETQIWVERSTWPENWLIVHARDRVTNEQFKLTLETADGSPIEPGIYNPADNPRQTTEDPEVRVLGPWGGCGSPSRGGFSILSMERDTGGVPISFTVTFDFTCGDTFWPMTGWIRYNATDAVPSLGLPDAGPVFDPVVQGDTGVPVAFPMTNDGEVPVSIGDISLAGADAADFRIQDDDCSGARVAPAASCSFDVVFAPVDAGSATATLVIPSDLPVSPRRLGIAGQALIAIQVSPPVAIADSTYHVPGVRYEATLTPATEYGTVECLVDGETLGGSGVDGDGRVWCTGPRPEPGQHELVVHYLGSPFDGEATSPVSTFTVDETTTTTVTTDRSTAPANAIVRVTATVGYAGDLAYDGGTMTITDETTGAVLAQGPVGPSAPSLAVQRTFTQGPHHLVASYSGIAGTHDPSSGSTDHAATAPDLVPPSAAAPRATLDRGPALVSGRVPVRIAWSGADTGSGVARYELRQQTDDGPWSTVSTTLTSPALVRELAYGHHYRYQVRSIDRAGNASPWATAARFTLSGYHDTSASIAWSGTWPRSTSSPSWWGGRARLSSSAGATARFTFTGRSVAWVGLRASNRGIARVYVNGSFVATVDLRSTTFLPRQAVWVANYATSATRTVTIRVLGTAGRPRVDVDGFLVIR